jgi:hypothetical protein
VVGTEIITSDYRHARGTVSDAFTQGDRETVIKFLVELTSGIDMCHIILVSRNDVLQRDHFRVDALGVRRVS